MMVTMVTYTETWNIAFKTSKPAWKIGEYKIKHIVYLEENKFNSRKKGQQYCLISFYPKDMPTFNELVIKSNPVMK